MECGEQRWTWSIVEFFITWKDRFLFSRNISCFSNSQIFFWKIQNQENSLIFKKLIKWSEPINRLITEKFITIFFYEFSSNILWKSLFWKLNENWFSGSMLNSIKIYADKLNGKFNFLGLLRFYWIMMIEIVIFNFIVKRCWQEETSMVENISKPNSPENNKTFCRNSSRQAWKWKTSIWPVSVRDKLK